MLLITGSLLGGLAVVAVFIQAPVAAAGFGAVAFWLVGNSG